MEGTYQISRWWRIVIIVAGAALVLGGIAVAANDLFSGNQDNGLYFLSAAMIVFGALFLNEAIKTKLVIDTDSLTMITGFSNRSLLFQEVQGFRKGDKGTLILVPASGKSLEISKYIEGFDTIEYWVGEKFKDLDAATLQEETEEILNNENFGFTEEERERKLASAKSIAKAANAVGVGYLLWLLFYPKPYEIMMFVGIALPVVALLVTKYFNGLMRLDSDTKSAYPSVAILIYIPCFCLMISGLSYDIYEYNHIFVPVAAITVVLFLFCLVAAKQAMVAMKNNVFVMGFMAVCFCAYAYGVTTFINCHYDKSAATIYNVSVTDKRISTGKHTTYYLTLSSWGRFASPEETSVGHHFYESVSIGDTLQVNLMKGNLDIPWYSLSR